MRSLRWLRALAILILAVLGLGIGQPGATCAGPFSGKCHVRDPNTDHDGRDAQSKTCKAEPPPSGP